MKRRGKFIVLEGMNGCGKSFQSKRLMEKMIREGFPTDLVEEPSHHLPIGKLTRKLYLSGKRKLSNTAIANLIAVDRYEQMIEPDSGTIWKLKDGINIVQSRNYLSSLALDFDENNYSEEYLDFIYGINKMSINILQPDVIIFMDINEKTALKRIQNMKKKDIFEPEGMVHRNYIGNQNAVDYIRRKTDENLQIIDANGTPDEVLNNIWNVIKPILNSTKSI